MTNIEKMLRAERPYLADAGLETWLIFQERIDLPDFASIHLMKADRERERALLRAYFGRFVLMAQQAGTGFVLDTTTWRGGLSWASTLGMDEEELLRLNAESVRFALRIREEWRHLGIEILINGVVGPASDGYRAGTISSSREAQALHAPQIRCLAAEGADLVSAITMTNVAETIGIVNAASAVGLPAIASFTVETDGRLPGGDLLGDAIVAVDQATGDAPLFYMINCAHPDHFRHALAAGAPWVERIGGVRANASRLSHAELDACETLDDGDPEEFGRLHGELANLLPGIRLVGGCCGTDHRHVHCVAGQLDHRQRSPALA